MLDKGNGDKDKDKKNGGQDDQQNGGENVPMITCPGCGGEGHAVINGREQVCPVCQGKKKIPAGS